MRTCFHACSYGGGYGIAGFGERESTLLSLQLKLNFREMIRRKLKSADLTDIAFIVMVLQLTPAGYILIMSSTDQQRRAFRREGLRRRARAVGRSQVKEERSGGSAIRTRVFNQSVTPPIYLLVHLLHLLLPFKGIAFPTPSTPSAPVTTSGPARRCGRGTAAACRGWATRGSPT